MSSNNMDRKINYINKDFVSLRNALIDYAKTYFPNTYTDFSPASVGMQYIEMVAAVGDVLSYYIDSTLKESMLLYAEERENIIRLANSLGYRYKSAVPAYVVLDVYQLLPSKGVNGSEIDFRFGLNIRENMVVRSTTYPSVYFRTIEPIDFTVYDYNDDFETSVYEYDISQNPVLYLVKKKVRAIAGRITTHEVTFGSASPMQSITLPNTNVIEILDVYDSDNNRWYEVDYLAQDTVFFDELNSSLYNNEFDSDIQEAPYILKQKRYDKRFIVRTDVNGNTTIQFGSGTSNYPSEVLLPTNATVQYNTEFLSFYDNMQKTLLSNSYGISPSNTTLRFRYTVGGGFESNVPVNDLTTIDQIQIRNSENDYESPTDKELFRRIRSSVSVTNSEPGIGGRGSETNEEIRQNAIAFFKAQERCITLEDYKARALSMHPKYGNIPKIYVEKDSSSPFTINMYVLGYDKDKKLTNLNNTIKNNLIMYLQNYRDIGTGINIKDAFVINIGVKFSIIQFSKYNKNEVLYKCILELQKFFEIDKWQIGQPIILRDIYELLESVEGVRTVESLEIINKYDSNNGYSGNYYHIGAATRNGVIFTSADPSIFELKFPNKDIEGK